MKILLLLLMLLLTFLGCSRVESGHVGIKVNLLGGNKGVDTEVLGVGRYWISPNEDLYIFPTFQQNYVWTKDKAESSPDNEEISFQTMEGMSVSADVGITYHLEESKIPDIFQKYIKGVEEITDVYMRNNVRDALNSVASKYKVEYVYGQGKTDLLLEVQEKVKSELGDIGIIVDKLYWIGSVRLPHNVIQALNTKIEATQRAEQRENELRESEADAKKKIAIADGEAKSQISRASGEAKSMLLIADAEAKSNRLIANSLSDRIIAYEKAKAWDGRLPQVSGSTNSFVDLRGK